MEYEIYSNHRIEPEDFFCPYLCKICFRFNSKVLRLPGTDLLICKSCLNEMSNAIDCAIIDEITKIKDKDND